MATEIMPSLTETRFKVSNMVCEGCAEKIKTALTSLPGVKEVKSKILKKQIMVSYYQDKINQDKLKKVLQNEGYPAIEI